MLHRYGKFHLTVFVWITAIVLPAMALAHTEPVAQSQQNKANAVSEGRGDVTKLEVGKPIEREMKGGEAHVYGIKLAVGQYLSAIVDQRGIDVKVMVTGPDGKQIFECDNESR